MKAKFYISLYRGTSQILPTSIASPYHIIVSSANLFVPWGLDFSSPAKNLFCWSLLLQQLSVTFDLGLSFLESPSTLCLSSLSSSCVETPMLLYVGNGKVVVARLWPSSVIVWVAPFKSNLAKLDKKSTKSSTKL